MNVIDVYDIANSTWYKQATTGTPPSRRVDPCAVVAAAPDGSSFNIYLYGGQDLVPYGSQIQYSDMWILTIPSFTWIQVDMTGQSQPPARAGHTCNIWDGQIVVVGGYVGKDISCDSPGIYVFNASSLEWSNTFTSLAGSPDSPGWSPSSDGASSVMQGSYGYYVPGAVQSVIGGSSLGGATATTPASGPATSGPIATGKPPTFTITQSGSTIVQTSFSTSTVSSAPAPNNSATSKAAPEATERNVGAIVAGTVAGLLFVAAAYLAFCSWLYRRQLLLYKNHVAMAQRTAFAASPDQNTDWNPSNESGASGMRMSQSSRAGAMLGPFGTEIGGARNSLSHSNSSQSQSQNPTPGSGSVKAGQDNFVYGGGTMPGPTGISQGKQYGRLSEEGEDDTEYHGGGHHLAPSVGTGNSSMEDLLGGQEPSFFSVVLNPRRTLRVVNND
jgi:hypothetical protein